MSSTYNFRTPILAKVYSRPTAMNYYRGRFDTRVVRYTGSLQVPPSLAPSVVTITASSQMVTITFSTTVVLTGAANTALGWSITPPGSPMVIGVSVTGVSGSGTTTIVLTTSEQTGGAVYTLNFPQGLIYSTPGGLGFTGPFNRTFTGAVTPTPIISAISIDAQTTEIVFARAVQPAGALLASNYTMDHGVTVLAVRQVNSNTFLLTTTPQSSGVTYLLTADNIEDLAFNPI